MWLVPVIFGVLFLGLWLNVRAEEPEEDVDETICDE